MVVLGGVFLVAAPCNCSYSAASALKGFVSNVSGL